MTGTDDRQCTGTKSVLVVDDDPDMCQLLSALFGRQDIHVETAYDGVEGVEKVRASLPDLVVLDVMMPEVDGWETCRRMKALADVPIMFLSAKADIDSIGRGLDFGAVDYVCKPFHAADLTARVARLLAAETCLEVKLLVPPGAEPLPTVPTSTSPLQRRVHFAAKRVMDVLVAGALLVMLAPVLLLVAILIKLDSPGPAIFKQVRVGSRRKERDGEEIWANEAFTFLKFRTMYQDANPGPHRQYLRAFISNDQKAMASSPGGDSDIRKLTNDRRVTRLGRHLRRTSLDELPQLWNVLRGEMSLVGPRPAIPYEVEMYKQWHHRRLQGRPGLTGLWQVTSRSSADFDEMVRQDIWYIEHQSVWMDLKLIMKTPLSVLSLKGAV